MIGFLCRGGFEGVVSGELARAGAREDRSLARAGLAVAEVAEGIARPDPAFASQSLPSIERVEGESVAALARGVIAATREKLDASEGAWVQHVLVTEAEGSRSLASRAGLLGRTLDGLLKEGLRRASKRRVSWETLAPGDAAHVFQVALTRRDEVFCSFAKREPLASGFLEPSLAPLGRWPVAACREAPSSAFRKVEEAYVLLGREPKENESVCDLGAAPGGWSFSALRRGARVTAVDRAELLPPVRGHERLSHLKKDAFSWEPEERLDWLLCDAIAAPEKTISLLDRWLERDWCRRFVVNVKFKGNESYGAVEKLRAVLSRRGVVRARVKQLGSDKNEVTCLGHRSS
ncbi:hypothetical protein HY251_06605 [bacterium]|nr:hypothetical protein [bacterium]